MTGAGCDDVRGMQALKKSAHIIANAKLSTEKLQGKRLRRVGILRESSCASVSYVGTGRLKMLGVAEVGLGAF